MKEFIGPLHAAMSAILLLGYGRLIYCFATKSAADEATAHERAVAHLVRLLLLAVYLTGLLLTVLLNRAVHPFHHYAAAGPFLGIVAFKLVETYKDKVNVYRAYAWVFAFMALCVIVIGATACLSIVPKL